MVTSHLSPHRRPCEGCVALDVLVINGAGSGGQVRRCRSRTAAWPSRPWPDAPAAPTGARTPARRPWRPCGGAWRDAAWRPLRRPRLPSYPRASRTRQGKPAVAAWEVVGSGARSATPSYVGLNLRPVLAHLLRDAQGEAEVRGDARMVVGARLQRAQLLAASPPQLRPDRVVGRRHAGFRLRSFSLVLSRRGSSYHGAARTW